MTQTGDPLGALAVEVASLGRRQGAIALRLDKIEGRVDELDAIKQEVENLADQVAGLAETLQNGGRAAGDDGPSSPRPWCSVVKDGTGEGTPVAALVLWLDSVLIPQYGEALGGLHRQVKEPLPSCWPQHRAVANELWTLYQMWLLAYESPEGKVRDAADWHDRWLPGAIDRMQDVFTRCTHHESITAPQQRGVASTA